MADYLDIAMFVVAIIVLLRGYPVAFSLAGVALIFSLLGWALDIFIPADFLAYPKRIFGTMSNEVLVAVPLFIFMGVVLERSKIAEELLDTMGKLFGTLPGGLGISVSIVGGLLAASTGIVGATVVTMGLLSLPTMLNRGYCPRLATGSICASGTLGQIIPPSIVLVILGDQISNSYTSARLAMGDFSPEPVSVGDLFAGALIPGLMLVGMYIFYQVMVAVFSPHRSPAIQLEVGEKKPSLAQTFKVLVAPLALIVAVLGSILAGIASPTEAAAVGATGALFLAGVKLSDNSGWAIYAAVIAVIVALILTGTMDLRTMRETIEFNDKFAIAAALICCAVIAFGLCVSLWRIFQAGVLTQAMQTTTQVTTMVFVILIGASLFSLVFRGLGGEEHVHEILSSMPGGATGALIVVMLVTFVLGFFLDFLEIVFVVVPIVAPVLFMLGFDPVWLGIMLAINLQTSFLTPPFGFSLFYLRGVAPPQVTTGEIYRGVIPFVIIQLLMLGILWVFPELATWLPEVIYG